MLDQLDRDQRMQLMRLVCSFAWADLEVRPEERDFVARLVERLALDAEEVSQVRAWLQRPPDAVDPTTIPVAHRKLFLDTIEGVIAADGEVAEEERDSLEVLRELLS